MILNIAIGVCVIVLLLIAAIDYWGKPSEEDRRKH